MGEELTFALRFIISGMSAFLMGCTGVVAVQYYRAWMHRDKNDWQGLLPLHVFTVALSYNLLLLYATIEIMLRVGNGADHPTWRMLVLPPAYVLGLIAMAAMSKLRKKHRLREF